MSTPVNRKPTVSIASVLLQGVGGLLLLLGVRKLLYAAAYSPLFVYDEGILLTDSMLVAMGQVPYRDFYSNYGPGIFVTIAAAGKIFGASVFVERALGCALHLVIAALGGRIAGRAGDRRFSLLTTGLIILWLSALPPLPFAWLAGLALSLGVAWALSAAVDDGGPRSWSASGALLGVTSWFRPDLAGYLAASLAAVGSLWVARNAAARTLPRAWRSKVGWFVLGAAATALPVWVTLFCLSGTQPLYDLFLDQARHVAPARRLPFPPLFAPTADDDLPFAMPAFLVSRHAGSVVLGLCAPALALLLVLRAGRLGIVRRSVPAVVGAIAVAVLPQLTQRSDEVHCLFTVAPPLILFGALLEGAARSTPVGGLLATLGVALLYFPSRDVKPPLPWGPRFSTQALPRYGGIQETDPYRLELIAFLKAQTADDEAIFVGLADHRWTHMSDLLPYFLAERRGGARYLQFDTNLTNREDVQAGMIRDLEHRRVRWVVLSLGLSSYEPSEPAPMGSGSLDSYLKARFRPFVQFGRYVVLRRIPA
jgi:hypothetical protein